MRHWRKTKPRTYPNKNLIMEGRCLFLLGFFFCVCVNPQTEGTLNQLLPFLLAINLKFRLSAQVCVKDILPGLSAGISPQVSQFVSLSLCEILLNQLFQIIIKYVTFYYLPVSCRSIVDRCGSLGSCEPQIEFFYCYFLYNLIQIHGW